MFNPVLDNLILSLQYPNGQTRKTCHQAIERLVCMPEPILTYEILEEYIIPILLDLCAVDRIADEMKSDSLSCLLRLVGMQKSDSSVIKNYAVKSSHVRTSILRVWLEQSAIAITADLPDQNNSQGMNNNYQTHHHLLSPTSSFHLRQLCASLTPHLVQQMSSTQIEEDVIPRLVELAGDNVWGVRKAVAEVLAEITKRCSMKVRKERLIKLFQDFLEDRSRWVRMAAYHNLAAFIGALSAEEPVKEVMRIL